MRTVLTRRRTVLWLLGAVVLALLGGPRPARAQVWDDPVFGGSTSKPADKPAQDDPEESGEMTDRQKEIQEKLTAYYLEMFDKHLASRDWMTRGMAILSLNRLADERATERILKRLKADPAPLVKIFAWESLHSRYDLLSDDQREEWLRQGLHLTQRKILRGRLRIGLLRAITAEGPTATNKRFFTWLFQNTNSLDPADVPLLKEMQRTLRTWRSPDLARYLLRAMAKLDDAYRADYILRGLTNDVPSYQPLHKFGAAEMMRTNRARWTDWTREALLEEVEPKRLPSYDGSASLIDASERLASPDDPRWRQDLELERFDIKHLDVALLVDTTGSMGPVIQWIHRDVEKMMKIFHAVSREPRLGMTFYRDRGETYVVKPINLRSNARTLADQLAKEKAEGGGDDPEAVFDALDVTLDKFRWSRSSDARKVMVLISDAPPKPDSMDTIQKMLAKATDMGFRLYVVKVRHAIHATKGIPDPDLSALDKLAGWGKGSSTWVDFWPSVISEDEESRAVGGKRSPILLGVSPVLGNSAGYRAIVRAVLTDMLTDKTYADRVGTFVDILLESVEQTVPEKRTNFTKTQDYEPPKGNE